MVESQAKNDGNGGGGPIKFDLERQEVFLTAIAAGVTITEAAKTAGISMATLTNWRAVAEGRSWAPRVSEEKQSMAVAFMDAWEGAREQGRRFRAAACEDVMFLAATRGFKQRTVRIKEEPGQEQGEMAETERVTETKQPFPIWQAAGRFAEGADPERWGRVDRQTAVAIRAAAEQVKHADAEAALAELTETLSGLPKHVREAIAAKIAGEG